MDIFHIFSLMGGLALFLWGMNVMGDGLKKLSGGKLESILERLTSSPIKAVALGAGVTGIIQSSSATTVMVVGFVNSGIMELKQAVGIIMGANIGTTITSWILSMAGIEGESFWVQMLKPSSFAPILAFIGIILIMFSKQEKKQDIGTILLGFTVLMTGMDFMSDSVAPLADIPEFGQMMTMFSNPILGMIAGAVFTAIIQSSSASVGILQALCMTGTIPFNVALPVIMGQNIGTCVTAILSSIGASRNSKRAALIHFYFNLIGTSIFMIVFYIINFFVPFEFLDAPATAKGIAVIHTTFNVTATILLLPFSNQLVKLAQRTLPERQEIKVENPVAQLLDKRFLDNPGYALDRAREAAGIISANVWNMAGFVKSIIGNYEKGNRKEAFGQQKEIEENLQFLNDYLVTISKQSLSQKDNMEASHLLQIAGEVRGIIGNLLQIAETEKEREKQGVEYSEKAKRELEELWKKGEILLLQVCNLLDGKDVSPVEFISEEYKTLRKSVKKLKKHHIERLQSGKCSLKAGLAYLELIAHMEQMAANCVGLLDDVLVES